MDMFQSLSSSSMSGLDFQRAAILHALRSITSEDNIKLYNETIIIDELNGVIDGGKFATYIHQNILPQLPGIVTFIKKSVCNEMDNNKVGGKIEPEQVERIVESEKAAINRKKEVRGGNLRERWFRSAR